jgi:hypothetical protein
MKPYLLTLLYVTLVFTLIAVIGFDCFLVGMLKYFFMHKPLPDNSPLKLFIYCAFAGIALMNLLWVLCALQLHGNHRIMSKRVD